MSRKDLYDFQPDGPDPAAPDARPAGQGEVPKRPVEVIPLADDERDPADDAARRAQVHPRAVGGAEGGAEHSAAAEPEGASASEREEAALPSGKPRRQDETVSFDVGPLDVCPNCGANMPGPEEILCLRCGFDLKVGEVRETMTGIEEAGAPDEDEAERPALVPPGRGGVMVPAVTAGLALLFMCIMHLAGFHGLFPSGEEIDPPGVAARFGGMFRFLFFAAVFSGCFYAGLMVIARLEARPLGDPQLAFARSLVIAALCLLATLLPAPFGSRFLEWTGQVILMAPIFLGLTLLLLNLTPRDSARLGGVVALIMFALFGVAQVLASLI